MSTLTPVMKQYNSIKNNYKDCLLFFRLGDFYELFYEDACTASRVLGLVLTSRDFKKKSNNDKIPMCGLPYKSANAHIQKLIANGYKVAICDQLEESTSSKSLVKRDVVRVITAGTLTDSDQLSFDKNNYVLVIYKEMNKASISAIDVSTGEFLVTEVIDNKGFLNKCIIDEIERYRPSEMLCNKSYEEYVGDIEKIFNIKPQIYHEWSFKKDHAYKKLTSHFKIVNLKGFGIENNPIMICAAGALLTYVYETQKIHLYHITTLKRCKSDNYMIIDIHSRKNLELTETIRDKSKKGSLMGILDDTKTAMGARFIRKCIEQPLLNKVNIEHRLDAIEELKNDILLREEIRACLDNIYDIERLIAKISYTSANPRDLMSLSKSFKSLDLIKKSLINCSSRLLLDICKSINDFKSLVNLVDIAIKEDSPTEIKEGDIIRDNYNKDLDIFREAKVMGNTWLSKLEEQQRELTKIKNLKIKYVRVFGYCIEIPKGQISSVPSNYIRKQTLSNYERYTIPELIDIERKILEADDKIKILEYDIFCNIRGRFFEHMDAMQVNAQIIAEIDMLQSLATVAVKNKYCKPTINEKGYIDIKSGRHPVVEVMNKGDFIANDAYLDQEDDILSIISGPNMAGKSTFMRQIALIVLMAQMGSFIPAFSADICIVDRIFTRIGASDNLATGESTFMIEMMEVVNILNNATKDSLIIMDEVGRGTSTYDGLSIARAVIEYIVDKSVLGAKTLFSTHYLELNNLSKKVPGIKNYHVTVEPQSDEIIFLRKIIPGGSDNSYGIYVAKMAGMPVSILKRSEDMLSGLLKIAKFMDVIQEDEDDLYYGTKKGKSDPNKYRIIVNELMAKDLSDLDLPEALKWIAILKKQLLDTLIASK